MESAQLGKWLITIGAVALLIGAAVWLTGKTAFPLGKLPGDIRIQGENMSLYLPITTCIVISIVLTLIFNIAFRILGK